MLSRMPLGGLIPARSKTDPAKQLKEYFTVIETEQAKERKNYEEVNVLFHNQFDIRFFFF